MKRLLMRIVLIFTVFITGLIAEDNPRAVIIFDASGSMWGQINGKAKIEIARDALKNVVKEWNPAVELGLTVYGHRKKGDCNDIQTVIPVGKVDKNNVIRTVMDIKPKGKTPISRSLRKVADEIKYTEEKATIILISDGKETCDPDPCATAKELEKEGIDFVTHVIGFNVDKKTDKQLECIAHATGGEYFSAKNAAALNKAMKVIAKKVEVVTPSKPVVKKKKHNLVVTASETEGGKLIAASCSIYNEDKSDHWSMTVYKNKAESYAKELPVGKYTLDCTYNVFKRKDIPVEIKEGETSKVHVVFAQTGKVYATARETEGGKLIDASCRIYNEDKSDWWSLGAYKKEPKSHSRQIPVGKYTANCTYNVFERKDIPVEVKAGEMAHVDVVFPYFFVESKCSNPGDRVSYEIYAQSGELVYYKSTTCTKKIKVTLGEGAYSIEGKVKDAKATTKIDIGSKENQSVVLDFTTQNHEEEIQADTPAQPSSEETSKSGTQTITIGDKVINIDGLSDDEIKKLKEMQKMLQMFGNSK